MDKWMDLLMDVCVCVDMHVDLYVVMCMNMGEACACTCMSMHVCVCGNVHEHMHGHVHGYVHRCMHRQAGNHVYRYRSTGYAVDCLKGCDLSLPIPNMLYLGPNLLQPRMHAHTHGRRDLLCDEVAERPPKRSLLHPRPVTNMRASVRPWVRPCALVNVRGYACMCVRACVCACVHACVHTSPCPS